VLNLGQPITPAQRLQKAVVDIMSKDSYVALAGTLMIGDRSLKEGIPTACTNGRDEYYGPDFIETLTDAELRFVVLHEVYHKLYKHLTTWLWMFKEDAELANKACDYAINIRIVDDNTDKFAVMPKMGLIDDKYRGWSSAEIFHDLKRQGKGGGQGTGDGDPSGWDEHDWQNAEEMTPDEVRELGRELDEALRQGALLAGKTGSGGARNFDELLQPEVDWREALREFVQTTCAGSDYSTWKRPNRRYMSAGYYMPSGISEQIGEIIVAPDMSGSTFTPHMMRSIMSELKGIAEQVNAEAVRVLYWDTKICGDERYEQHELGQLITTTKPEGGGGTQVQCVSDRITKEGIKPQCVIVLTDGYLGGDWGTWPCPVLWVMVDNKSATASVGTTLHVKSRNI